MDIAVIDDEKYYRKLEKEVLEKNQGFSVSTFSTTTDFLHSGRTFDLLLLDIEMPNDDGISFAKQHTTDYPHIIFVTSHDELVYEAFHINVLGYIVKNRIETELLDKVLDVQKYMKLEKKIKFRTKTGYIDLYERDILYAYIHYDDFYIMTNQPNLIYCSSLKELLEQLSDHFILINRSEIVNIKMVEHIYKTNHTIEMKNGNVFKVSERRWKSFKEAYVKRLSV